MFPDKRGIINLALKARSSMSFVQVSLYVYFFYSVEII